MYKHIDEEMVLRQLVLIAGLGPIMASMGANRAEHLAAMLCLCEMGKMMVSPEQLAEVMALVESKRPLMQERMLLKQADADAPRTQFGDVGRA